jgi:hypothetical protein
VHDPLDLDHVAGLHAMLFAAGLDHRVHRWSSSRLVVPGRRRIQAS